MTKPDAMIDPHFYGADDAAPMPGCYWHYSRDAVPARTIYPGRAPKPTTSQSVTIIGPNLAQQHLGTFHVHAAGCADIARDPKHYGYAAVAPHWTIDASSCVAVAEEVYSDMIEDDETGADYVHDFHFAPCVTLPTD